MNANMNKLCYNTDSIEQHFDCSKCYGHLCDISSYLDNRHKRKTNVDINGYVVDGSIRFCPFCGRKVVSKDIYYACEKLYKQYCSL